MPLTQSGKFLRTTAPGLPSPTAATQLHLASHAEPRGPVSKFNCTACETNGTPRPAASLLPPPLPFLPSVIRGHVNGDVQEGFRSQRPGGLGKKRAVFNKHMTKSLPLAYRGVWLLMSHLHQPMCIAYLVPFLFPLH